MTIGAMRALVAGSLLTLFVHPASAAGSSPAELISSFRLQHGEARVTQDSTLNRIALEQAKAMAEKDKLDHSVLGSFSSRIAPSRAGRAAENIAYGYDTFEKTLGQWIDSSEHRKNLLLHNASRIGIASARDASGRRTYWAMEIAADYEEKKPKPIKGRKEKEQLIAKREAAPATSAADCHIKILSVCF
jgi:Cysteine-rich secretory protein family